MKSRILSVVLVLCAVSFANAQTTYNVAWAELISITLNADNTLSRPSGAAWGGSAAGLNVLAPSTDGYLQFTWAAGTSNYMIGLSRFNPDATYTSIDYALYLNAGAIGIYESGASR